MSLGPELEEEEQVREHICGRIDRMLTVWIYEIKKKKGEDLSTGLRFV